MTFEFWINWNFINFNWKIWKSFLSTYFLKSLKILLNRFLWFLIFFYNCAIQTYLFCFFYVKEKCQTYGHVKCIHSFFYNSTPFDICVMFCAKSAGLRLEGKGKDIKNCEKRQIWSDIISSSIIYTPNNW